MVDVVQLVEHRIVVPSVVGSSPIIHPPQAAGIIARGFFVLPRLRGKCIFGPKRASRVPSAPREAQKRAQMRFSRNWRA